MRLLFLVSALCAGLIPYLNELDPGLRVSVHTTAASAQDLARSFLLQHSLPPFQSNKTDGIDCAVIFVPFTSLKNYIEVSSTSNENGIASFLASNGPIPLHGWHVRCFRELDSQETKVGVSLDGRVWWYNAHYQDSTSLPSLTKPEALELANTFVDAEFPSVRDFASNLTLQSHSMATQNESGRQDHTLVYQDNDVKVSEAPFRLTVRVVGNVVKNVYPEFVVPSSHYNWMSYKRAANENIAGAAGIALVVLTTVISVVGIWTLYKKQAINKSLAGLVAGVNVFGIVAVFVNQWPSRFYDYDSAVSKGAFLKSMYLNVSSFAFSLVAGNLLTVVVADGLTRLAFPEFLSIWHACASLFSKQGPPAQVRTQFIMGTLLTPIFLCYAALFSYVSEKYFGFWSPSAFEFNGVHLTSLVPALPSLFSALQAGAMEECVFRAMFLASAALVGDRFHCRKQCVGIMFLVQVVLFGACHANYPQTPSYARVVELILPSVGFGMLYLRYGLLPVILVHFYYDVVAMGYSILVGSVRDYWVSQLIIVAVLVGPALVCWIRSFDEDEGKPVWNKDLKPEAISFTVLPNWSPQRGSPIQTRLRRAAFLSAIGAALYAIGSTIGNPGTHILGSQISKLDSLAQTALLQTHLGLTHHLNNTAYSALASLAVSDAIDPEYVYRAKLVGSDVLAKLQQEPFFQSPRWRVRVKMAEIPTEAAVSDAERAQRAEVLDVKWDRFGRLQSFSKVVWEEVTGQSMEEEEAVEIAFAFLQGLEAGGKSSGLGLLKEEILPRITVAKNLKNRRDWVVTVADGRYSNLPFAAEIRHHMTVSDGLVVHWSTSLFKTEEYRRTLRSDTNGLEAILWATKGISVVCILVVSIAFLFKAASGHVKWSLLLTIVGLNVVASALGLINDKDLLRINIDRSSLVLPQIMSLVVFPTASIILVAAVFSLVAVAPVAPFTLAKKSSTRSSKWINLPRFGIAISRGMLFRGIRRVFESLLQEPVVFRLPSSLSPNAASPVLPVAIEFFRSVNRLILEASVYQWVAHSTGGFKPVGILLDAVVMGGLSCSDSSDVVCAAHLDLFLMSFVKGAVLATVANALYGAFDFQDALAGFIVEEIWGTVMLQEDVRLRVSVHTTAASAQDLARSFLLQHSLPPFQSNQTDGIDCAVIFVPFTSLKNYIEVSSTSNENGITSFLASNGPVPLHGWHVRCFRELDAQDTLVGVSLDGRVWWYEAHYQDSTSLPSLTKPEALELANTFVDAEFPSVRHFASNLTLQSHSMATQDESGRQDHTLVYQDNGVKVSEAPFRLTVRVVGNVVRNVYPEFVVPSSHYNWMSYKRAANENIAGAAGIALVVLTTVISVVGIWTLYKKQAINKSLAGLVAGVNVFGIVAVFVNQWPSRFYDYDSAVSKGAFLKSMYLNVSSFAFSLVAGNLLTVVVADGLTRLAFPEFLSIWHACASLFSKQGPPAQVRTQFIMGTLLTPIFLCYAALFSYVSEKYFGFWSPSAFEFNGVHLTSLVPALPSLFSALQAGAMEECVFRAMFLASAALVGDRFHCRKQCVGVMFVVQVMVFGACHANYPQTPSYARVVELILPSVGFGMLYLRYGLLPVILVHFYYDVVAMGWSVLVGSVRDYWVSQLIIVAVLVGPALVCWIRGFGRDERKPVWNKDLKPEAISFTVLPNWSPQRGSPIQTRLRRAAFLSAIGAALYAIGSTIGNPGTHILGSQISKLDSLAQTALLQTHLGLTHHLNNTAYSALASLAVADAIDPEYVYRAKLVGSEVLAKLQQEPFFQSPRWRVRVKMAEIPTEAAVSDAERTQRAEVLDVKWDRFGRLQSFSKVVWEEVTGQWMEEEEAVEIAFAFLQGVEAGGKSSGLGLLKEEILPRITVAKNLKNRRDWVVTVADGRYSNLPFAAEIRHHVTVSDGLVVHWSTSLFKTEEYQRALRSDTNGLEAILWAAKGISVVFILVVSIAFLFKAASGHVKWSLFLTMVGFDVVESALRLIIEKDLLRINIDRSSLVLPQIMSLVVFPTASTILVEAVFLLVAAAPVTPFSLAKKSSTRSRMWINLPRFVIAISRGMLFRGIRRVFESLLQEPVVFHLPSVLNPNAASPVLPVAIEFFRSVIRLILEASVYQLVAHSTGGFKPVGILLDAVVMGGLSCSDSSDVVCAAHLDLFLMSFVKGAVLATVANTLYGAFDFQDALAGSIVERIWGTVMLQEDGFVGVNWLVVVGHVVAQVAAYFFVCRVYSLSVERVSGAVGEEKEKVE
ncbi:hypothetical protein HDU98_006768 [Podochytrium sp. JEL0797]|nr:hypothetical protein HDU98_006768 [Podochytrium sp. JEL0797]